MNWAGKGVELFVKCDDGVCQQAVLLVRRADYHGIYSDCHGDSCDRGIVGEEDWSPASMEKGGDHMARFDISCVGMSVVHHHYHWLYNDGHARIAFDAIVAGQQPDAMSLINFKTIILVLRHA